MIYDYSKIRGFNYQPSYGSTSYEIWLTFNADLFELELRRGKEYFPGFSTVRLWLSFHAYLFQPSKFMRNFEQALAICDRLGLKAVICLFNRWADSHQDNGGIPLDYIIPNMRVHDWYVPMDRFVKEVVTAHRADERVLIWDVCNEPCSYTVTDQNRSIYEMEINWLKRYSDLIRACSPAAPVGVSINSMPELERIAAFSDILLVHPYYIADETTVFDTAKRAAYIEEVKQLSALQQKLKKPMLVTETCWGANKDETRVEIIRFTLEVLKKQNLGFLAHALHYSLVPDLHDEQDGPVGQPGNLAFINKDGTLRKGHEIFNQY